MKTFSTFLAVSAVALGLMAQESMAESPNTKAKVAVKVSRVESMDSPTMATGTAEKPFKPKKWAYIEAELKVQALPVPKTGYLDNLTVKFYVVSKSPEGPKGMLLMNKEIKYVNIPVDQPIYVCAFMSPSSIRRLTGGETVSAGLFKRIGVEVTYKGAIVGSDSNSGKPGWWNSTSKTIIPTTSYPLLNKNETPFSIFWYDRYPEIASPKDDDASSSSESSSSVDA
ncbi:MAG: Amuc_1102 family pilus-like protein [Akkermansia sp.]